MRKDNGGFVLVGVLAVLVVMIILIPALISWVGHESKWGVKEQKNTTAYNLAEAGADRAYWKLKSSTITWNNALTGVPIANHDFSHTFRDVAGGSYRIRITSGPAANQVTVVAEGRDNANKQTRAVRAIYADLAIPGALISGGVISQSGTAVVHWGPVMAMGNINLSGSASGRYFPRKLSKNVVTPRDPTNNVNPPNTDNVEWWSAYDVPELPIFDYAALRSSAAATGTLNCNGNAGSGWGGGGSGSNIPCGSACTNCSIQNIYKDPRYDDNVVWFWDNNVSFSGQNGLIGTTFVLGNLSTAGSDNYNPPAVPVPANAWQEYQDPNIGDTAASNQYPADNGYRSNAATYNIGACGTSCEGSASGGDVGYYGFVYVGGTITIAGDSDVYGAVWVNGGWSGAGNVMVFFNDKLKLPQRNVTMSRLEWQEVPPSSVAWAP